ncbi:MAG: hypothetical protein EZS28_035446, partial [Streblomastix strix]
MRQESNSLVNQRFVGETVESKLQFVTLKADEKFEISTQEPWVIRRKEDGFIPKFSKNNSGYLFGMFGEQVYSLHRLVAEQFVKNDDPINKTQIDHKNGVKTDNSITNLRYVSPSDNQKNKTKHNTDIIYEYIDELPDDAITISDYGTHQVLHTNEEKRSGALFVIAYDSNDNQFKVLDQIAETVNFVDQSLSQWYDQYILQYSEKYPQKIYAQHKPKKSKKLAKDDLFQVIAQKQFPFKSKYDVIRKANYYDIPTHQTKNQFDIYPQTNTLEPHDYQLKPLSKFERPYFSPSPLISSIQT